ncbi:NAD(P)-dependent oxidoreductase [Bilophila wadsworthia]|uniref:NAD(P)-dependent oxidoreductase n=1 Tax=Bilophila wadsworthia TaxID=35833 RepID=UPI00399D08FF
MRRHGNASSTGAPANCSAPPWASSGSAASAGRWPPPCGLRGNGRGLRRLLARGFRAGARHPARQSRQLFAVSDIVTLHCPLMDATRGLVDAARLASMKPGAILVNAARGGIVDETALAAALERGVIRGAAIDNFESEIPSPGNPLLRLSPEARRRVLFSPHLAGVTRAAFARLIRQAIGNLENSLRGLPPQFSVNGLSSIRPSA